ncbi:MAG TPA: hypothetical protein VGK50_08270 [Coriobacteriia bacterium]
MNIQDLIVTLRTALSGDQSGRLVIAAALVVFVAVLVVAVAFIARTMSPSGRLKSLLESEAASHRRSPAWAVRVAVLLLFLVAVLGTRYYLGSPQTCAQCHAKSPEAEALAQTAHKAVQCGDCHSGSGATGGLRLGIDYVRWTYVWTASGQLPKKLTTRVDALKCLDCHGDIGPTRIVAGTRVRHSDFLDEGVQCGTCHGDVAHPGVLRTASAPGMDQCLPCHDGKRAPSECATCHTRDLTQRSRSVAPLARIQVSGGKQVCYRCHDPRPCLRCHGVNMPHPDGWSPKSGANQGGTHAREAFLHLEWCWRCHFDKKPGTPSQQSCTCHRLVTQGGMHGGKAWIAEHGLEATGKKPGTLADCFSCHLPGSCTNCHPASIEKLYNPVVGIDNYKRDKPLDRRWLDF